MPTKILSISQNKSMNYLIQTVVSAHYKVVTSSNINGGLNELKKRRDIDLIVIDIDYSTQENMEFLNYMVNSSAHLKPVVVLASEADAFKLISAKTLYKGVIKPFDPIQLISAINQLLKSSLVNI